ncbi:Subtilisin-like protein [Penicillium taxi]|uniref:Subtilisin-like protein n=1 Tax=Penicillium taxi TaxID=168475 RepID=UPI002544E642|nr:Subtilisin-like protein [Penicillium taxi]KAJ5898749.1 Subtilisin-like protein [Penicillium taxi]
MSTPPGEDWQCRDGKYIYPAEAGSDIYLYQIEDGVQSGYEKEFENRVEPALRTEASWQDDGDIDKRLDVWHSTCVAAKAVGKHLGSAKKAKIVPVIHESDFVDFIESLDLIISNIKEDKESKLPVRYKSSILFFSSGFDPEDLAEAGINPNEPPFSEMKKSMEEIFDLGIPIVMAAGNRRGEDGLSLELDIYPQVWESDDFPAINIGNAFSDGQIYESSLRGPKVAVYLDGVGIRCVGRDGLVAGTSFSTPLGAGGIGVYMSQKEGPFYDATHHGAGTREFVVAVRKFIKTQGSWLSPNGARMFWNQAP